MVDSLPNDGTRDDADSDRRNETENHRLFVAALETNGYSAEASAWDRMAEELGWSVEEVKTYAYRYFNALLVKTEDDSPHARERDDEDSAWSTEESILFEALLIRNLPATSQSEKEVPWEQRIASRIPGKTAQDIKRRYEFYCKE